MSEWISVKDRLPEIPKDNWAVQVLVVEHDPCYAELTGGDGNQVHCVMYGYVKDRKGKYFEFFEGTDIEEDFYTMYYGHEYFSYGPTGDEVTHWMYLPEPPTRK